MCPVHTSALAFREAVCVCVCVFSPIFNKVQGADSMEEKGKCEKVEDLNEVE